MKRTSFFALLMAGLIATSTSTTAKAGGVIECNNCPSTVNAAISKGNGLTMVVDFEKAQLNAYEVEYDREMRRWRAIRAPIPDQISASFYRIMEASSIARASSTYGTKPQPSSQDSDSLSLHQPNKGKGGFTVTVRPDNPQHVNPAGLTFPAAYKDYSASDLILSATARTRFGQYLGAGLAGAETSSAAWNSIALTVQELALSFGENFGAGAIIVIVEWRDGSRTVYKVTADNVAEAKYVEGESRDSVGNKLPDATISAPATAPGYAGDYYFGEGANGSNNLNKWSRSASLYGVPVHYVSGSRSRMRCSWDGRTIACYAY